MSRQLIEAKKHLPNMNAARNRFFVEFVTSIQLNTNYALVEPVGITKALRFRCVRVWPINRRGRNRSCLLPRQLEGSGVQQKREQTVTVQVKVLNLL